MWNLSSPPSRDLRSGWTWHNEDTEIDQMQNISIYSLNIFKFINYQGRKRVIILRPQILWRTLQPGATVQLASWESVRQSQPGSRQRDWPVLSCRKNELHQRLEVGPGIKGTFRAIFSTKGRWEKSIQKLKEARVCCRLLVNGDHGSPTRTRVCMLTPDVQYSLNVYCLHNTKLSSWQEHKNWTIDMRGAQDKQAARSLLYDTAYNAGCVIIEGGKKL